MRIDLFILQNLLYDALLVSSVALVIRNRPSILRFTVALVVSLALSAVSFLYIQFLLPFIPLLTVKLAFAPQIRRQYVKTVIYFYVFSAMLSGILHMMRYFVHFNLNIWQYLIVTLSIAFALAVLWIIKMKWLVSANALNEFFREVRFFCGPFEIKGVGFVDTGNHLIDEKTSRPVMIVPQLKISDDKLGNVLERAGLKTWRTTYSVINDDSKELVTFKPTLLMIDDVIVKDVVIGICDSKFSKYDFLLQPDIVQHI